MNLARMSACVAARHCAARWSYPALARWSARPVIHGRPCPSLAVRASSSLGAQDGTPSEPVKPKKPGAKARLDELALLEYPEYSRNVVQSWIAQGKVLVNGQPVTKAGTKLRPDVKILITAETPKYVCRGGLKLEKALDEFEIDPNNLVALDSGLSTGGFTDCLLQRGATRVYGVDVGYGQVHEQIRTDPRVTVMERTNLRYLQPLPEPVDLACLDLSFISVLKVLPAVAAATRPGGRLVVLIKPQFEAKRSQIGSKGVVRDPKVHEEVIARVIDGAGTMGWEYVRHTVSPIKGAKEGNTEFLALFNRTGEEMPWPEPAPEKEKPAES